MSKYFPNNSLSLITKQFIMKQCSLRSVMRYMTHIVMLYQCKTYKIYLNISGTPDEMFFCAITS